MNPFYFVVPLLATALSVPLVHYLLKAATPPPLPLPPAETPSPVEAARKQGTLAYRTGIFWVLAWILINATLAILVSLLGGLMLAIALGLLPAWIFLRKKQAWFWVGWFFLSLALFTLGLLLPGIIGQNLPEYTAQGQLANLFQPNWLYLLAHLAIGSLAYYAIEREEANAPAGSVPGDLA